MMADQRDKLVKLRALVVDDNAHMTHILRTMLNGFGVRDVTDARNGVDALELLRAKSFDFILLDYCMPILDGLEFTNLVRKGTDHRHYMVPIIMVTGFTERSRIVAARDHGVTEICVKPVTPRDLWLRIVEIVNSPRPFIRTKTYTGPDRHRMRIAAYHGPERRKQETEAA